MAAEDLAEDADARVNMDTGRVVVKRRRVLGDPCLLPRTH